MLFWMQNHGTAAMAVLVTAVFALAVVILLWVLFG